MIIGGVIQAIGMVIVACGWNFASMFTGRLIMGCGAGMAFAGPEMYASEVLITRPAVMETPKLHSPS